MVTEKHLQTHPINVKYCIICGNAIKNEPIIDSYGNTYCENLICWWTEKAIELPHEIKKLKNDYDFYFVSLSCSFLPDTDCRFVWVRFGIKLSAHSESREQENPIAHDMVPDEVLTEMKHRRNVIINPGLKVSLGAIDTDAILMLKLRRI